MKNVVFYTIQVVTYKIYIGAFKYKELDLEKKETKLDESLSLILEIPHTPTGASTNPKKLDLEININHTFI